MRDIVRNTAARILSHADLDEDDGIFCCLRVLAPNDEIKVAGGVHFYNLALASHSSLYVVVRSKWTTKHAASVEGLSSSSL